MKAFLTEAYSPQSLAWLKTKESITLLDDTHKTEAEILLIRSHTKITPSFLNSFKNLKLIATATSGFDHLNWPLCLERGITATFCPSANAQSAAEHTLFMMLSLLKNSNQQYRGIRSGLWREGLERSSLLSEQTVGLVGFGRIGQKVAQLCQAFGAHVCAHDPYQTDEAFQNLKIERKGFMEILKESDVISLHVPLTTETHHMINGSTLSEMSDQVVLVNASRGAVIEESDLMQALRLKKIKAAALDVFAKEPIEATSFLLKEPKLFITPHTGAYSYSAWEKSSMEAVEKAYAFSKDEKISDCLPLSTPWFKKALNSP